MSIVKIKKSLLQGKFPGESNINGTQIKYLVATVPCIKIFNPNTTQYYFPGTKTYLSVAYYPGAFGSSGKSDGFLRIVDHDFKALNYNGRLTVTYMVV